MDPNSRLTAITSKYSELKSMYTVVQTVQVKLKKSNCQWYNFDVWSLSKVRDNVLRRWKRNREDAELTEMLAHVNKQLTTVKRKAKLEYHQAIFSTNNPKTLWNRINDVLGNNSKSKTLTLEVDDREILEPCSVADAFNEYFTSIGGKLAQRMTSSGDINRFNTIKYISNSIFISPATAGEVTEIIGLMNPSKAAGHDKLPVSAIKQHVQEFSTILATAFNDSVCQGNYPECLKLALVHPVFKSGNSKMLNNYRPISVLPAMNKIFESLLAVRLTSFLNANNFFYRNQHGFRKAASTEVAVLELMDELSESIDQKKQLAGALFLDLSKAFDTINHELLLKKMDAYGIRGLPHKLMQSYLSNRQQVVTINGVTSAQMGISIGVPQGSNLGPLLFLIFINDLSNLKLRGVPRLFADDTVLSYGNKYAESMTIEMSEDLVEIEAFLDNNLLSLNVSKTKTIIFRGVRTVVPEHPKVSLHGVEVEEVDSFKYLGIYLDKNLSWKTHISRLEKSCAPICGILRKLSYFLPRHVLLKVYHSFVHSRYQYGASVWGSVSLPQLKGLQVQQNRSLKAIFRLPHLHPTIELYSSIRHNILPIVALHELQTVILMHRIIRLKDLHHNFNFHQASHHIGTRNAERIVISNFSTEIGRRRFTCCGPRLYNSQTREVKNSESIYTLKRKLKTELRNNIIRLLCQ